MSRGHGKVERWLLEEGLTEEPQRVVDLAHRWHMHTLGRECTGLRVCCDNPAFMPTRSERESVRRAIKRLDAADSRVVRGGREFVVYWTTDYHSPLDPDSIVIEGELLAVLLPED